MESAESENGRLQRMNAWAVRCEKTGCVVLVCRGTTCMVMVIHFDNLLRPKVEDDHSYATAGDDML